MNKFINSNIGLLFVLTMLVCAAGVEAMINQQAFSEVFGDVPVNSNPDMFVQGQQDCKEGALPKSQHPSYLGGYGFQYELEQVQGVER